MQLDLSINTVRIQFIHAHCSSLCHLTQMDIFIEGEDFGFLFTPIYGIVCDDQTVSCVEWWWSEGLTFSML